ncbi:SOS response-associated peptidase family protein [Holosporaceae bacterium 'Namur']|nr:SOS response-associated peptidase family protein [Holosporaceae bacterium 'Namur']
MLALPYTYLHISFLATQPFIKPKSGKSDIFSFAGIWDTWQDQEGKTLITCAIITQDTSPALKFIHSRMPVIIPDQKVSLMLLRIV